MKCEFCGDNLNIEDEVCPHCGKPNASALKHNADMHRYKMEFDATKEEVLGNSKRFNAKTARIAIICGMVACIAVLCTVRYKLYDIESKLDNLRIKTHAKTYMAQLDMYEQNRDYLGLSDYVKGNGLGSVYKTALESYEDIIYCSNGYYYIYMDTLHIIDDSKNKSMTNAEYCNQIARYVNNIMEYSETGRYSKKKYYTDAHIAYVHDMRSDIENLFITYFGFDKDNVAEIWDMDSSRLSVRMNDYLNED
ncbi:MAG: hypothetical protein KBT19_03220 [Lachnospiraceae bacterium]|nr:hypothetical protein [Candidatus Colinaster equi]